MTVQLRTCLLLSRNNQSWHPRQLVIYGHDLKYYEHVTNLLKGDLDLRYFEGSFDNSSNHVVNTSLSLPKLKVITFPNKIKK
jgi:hypothetical protein